MQEARYYEPVAGEPEGQVRCLLCPHQCLIARGKTGRCGVRHNKAGQLYALTYGQYCSLALDPVEKKPLYHFYPGEEILSIGSWGCNLRCPFCQNWEISQQTALTRAITPKELAQKALEAGSIGVAYTYNEPYINFEFVMDCCREVRALGLKNVMVSNGFYNPLPLMELLPWVDAFNIDIKAFGEDFYKTLCCGALQPVLSAVEKACHSTHVEVTTLLIPEANDDPEELHALGRWLREHCGAFIPLHLTAYAPRFKFTAPATSREDLAKARDIMTRYLKHVYVGNLHTSDWQNTYCSSCGAELVGRNGYRSALLGVDENGLCTGCGAASGIIL